ncbi:hypothetical protein HYALB_00001643 [Hymenoscyphus albidus]|uniref:BTB domain-containing protein n=1 Tax=Hymenoscyphus albidus TaxID=595503 RepID=A0A9N9LBL1_9HELO|nr:hypothetical protein HYALB_00001643 [Hymenoscyphus albidus]
MNANRQDVKPEDEAPEGFSLMTYSEYMRGPKVNIDVGIGNDQKRYCFPKNVVCHFSPYLDRYFNGYGQSQTLALPEDSHVFFITLFEYMLSGKVNKDLLISRILSRPHHGHGKVLFDRSSYVDTCRSFLIYTDKFELGNIGSDLLCLPWSKIWGMPPCILMGRDRYKHQELSKLVIDFDFHPINIRGRDIETIYATTPEGHPLRRLAVAAASFLVYNDDWSIKKDAPFATQEGEVKGFASDMLRLVRHRNRFVGLMGE